MQSAYFSSSSFTHPLHFELNFSSKLYFLIEPNKKKSSCSKKSQLIEGNAEMI